MTVMSRRYQRQTYKFYFKFRKEGNHDGVFLFFRLGVWHQVRT